MAIQKTAKQLVRRAGSTMIELLIVAALLGSVAGSIYLALVYGESINQRAYHLSRASQIASQEIEIIRSTPYASLTVPYNGAFIGSTDPLTDLPSGTANLTTSWQNSPTNTIKKAVVTVNWLEKGSNRQVQYTTLIVESGIGQ